MVSVVVADTDEVYSGEIGYWISEIWAKRVKEDRDATRTRNEKGCVAQPPELGYEMIVLRECRLELRDRGDLQVLG